MNFARDSDLFHVISLMSFRKLSKLCQVQLRSAWGRGGAGGCAPAPGAHGMPGSCQQQAPCVRCALVTPQCSLKACPDFIIAQMPSFNTHPRYFIKYSGFLEMGLQEWFADP